MFSVNVFDILLQNITVTSTMETRPVRRAGADKKAGRHDEGIRQDEGIRGMDQQDDITTTTRTRTATDEDEYTDEILGGIFGSLGALGCLAGGAALAKRLRKRSRTVQIPEVSLNKSETKFKNTKIKCLNTYINNFYMWNFKWGSFLHVEF